MYSQHHHLSPPPQYLHKLFKRDHHKGQKYHERQIGLYAEYDRPNLLPFLRDSTHCPLENVQVLPVLKLYTYVFWDCKTSQLLFFFPSGPGGVSAEELCRGDRLLAQWVLTKIFFLLLAVFEISNPGNVAPRQDGELQTSSADDHGGAGGCGQSHRICQRARRRRALGGPHLVLYWQTTCVTASY